MASALIPAPFRKDLKLYPGPKEADGSPTFNLYEPVSAKYFKLSWEESLIYKLAKEGMSCEEIAEEIRNKTTADMNSKDIELFFRQATALGLLRRPLRGEDIERRSRAKEQSPLLWFILHYLYFRIPLFHPNTFLERTLPYVKWLWSPKMILTYLTLTIVGLLMLSTQVDTYIHTYTYFFTLEGIIALMLTVSVVKVFHELAHAYTAKNYDVEVPTIGFAFIVLWPVLYTDVTDSWKLKKRSQRLAISIAGIVAELVIAGLAILGWVMSPPGIARSLFFMVSSVTLVSSLLINLNPILRFDGYYILCDLWGIDNLRSRAFAVARWKMREWLYGLGLPCPEESMDKKTIRGMYLYSYVSWVYLLFLYTVIALFVYHHFTKAVGITLFFLEIGIFFAWPIVSEVKQLYMLRRRFHFNWRIAATTTVLCLLLFWLIIPLPRKESFPAITIPVEEQVLYVPTNGFIEEIYVGRGDAVSPGDSLITLRNPELEKRIALGKQELQALKKKIQIFRTIPKYSPLISQMEAQADAQALDLKGLIYLQDQLKLKANILGELFFWDESLKVGQPISVNHVLGKIADTMKNDVIAYVPEKLISMISLEQKVTFRMLNSPIEVAGHVTGIQQVATNYLEYPSLASVIGGPLPVVKEKDNQLIMSDSYFQVYITLDKEAPLRYDRIGEIVLVTPPQSMLVRLVHYLFSLFMQESSL